MILHGSLGRVKRLSQRPCVVVARQDGPREKRLASTRPIRQHVGFFVHNVSGSRLPTAAELVDSPLLCHFDTDLVRDMDAEEARAGESVVFACGTCFISRVLIQHKQQPRKQVNRSSRVGVGVPWEGEPVCHH